MLKKTLASRASSVTEGCRGKTYKKSIALQSQGAEDAKNKHKRQGILHFPDRERRDRASGYPTGYDPQGCMPQKSAVLTFADRIAASRLISFVIALTVPAAIILVGWLAYWLHHVENLRLGLVS